MSSKESFPSFKKTRLRLSRKWYASQTPIENDKKRFVANVIPFCRERGKNIIRNTIDTAT